MINVEPYIMTPGKYSITVHYDRVKINFPNVWEDENIWWYIAYAFRSLINHIEKPPHRAKTEWPPGWDLYEN